MEEVTRFEAQEISVLRDPEEVIREAKQAAEALTRVISSKPDKVFINGQQYLELEDWTLLGKFYGLTAMIASTAPVNFGNVRGWEAHAVITDRSGREVGAADAMCLNDEEKWSTKAKYEYFYMLKDGTKQKDNPPKNKIIWIENPKRPGSKMPRKERVKVADEPVPFFQLRSMAQTRACSKAMRQVLSWVVVLAGLKPTSAEEVEQPIPEEEEPTQQTQHPTAENKPENITDDQKNNILYQLKKKNLGTEDLELAMGKKLAEYQGIKDVNAALEWIGKQKGN